MSTSLAWFGLVVLGGALVAMSGCTRAPSRIYPPKMDASSAASQAISEFDTNKDGVLDAQELEKVPGLKAAMPHLDASGDGRVTADEIAACVRSWQETRVGRTPITVRVKREGVPLEGATVTLVPEKFLGSDIPTATGTTDVNGVSIPSVPVGEGEPPGVPYGFYRVQVTKSGMEIPAQFNTATTLGMEVAKEAVQIRTGYDFDIK